VARRRGLARKRRSFAAAKPGGKTSPVIGWDPVQQVFRPAIDPLEEWRKAQRNKRPV
jgi:hypothetical protein